MRRLIVGIAMAVGGFPTSATAQSNGAWTPTEIVRHIQSSGTAAGLIPQVTFRGCPQEDQQHRATFSEIARATLPPQALADLALFWSQALPCDFVPMDQWYGSALDQVIASGDHLAVFKFLSAVPQDMPESWRESMWRAAESGRFSGIVAANLASAAVSDSDANRRVERTIAALRDRPEAPREWINSAVFALARDQPDTFFPRLIQETGSMPDEQLEVILAVLSGAVARGHLDPNDPHVRRLRGQVASRVGIADYIRNLGLDPPVQR